MSTHAIPLDGIVKFSRLAQEENDWVLRITAVAHACLHLISAIATQSVRAIMHLIALRPKEAGRELIGILVQAVALPVLGIVRTLSVYGVAKKTENWFCGWHRSTNIKHHNKPAYMFAGLCTFPINLVQTTTTSVSNILTLNKKRINQIPSDVASNLVGLLTTLVLGACIFKENAEETPMYRVFISPKTSSGFDRV